VVLGSDGKLGAKMLESLGKNAYGTTRNNQKKGKLYLDLTDFYSIDNLEFSPNTSHAIFVAAISEPDQCFQNPEFFQKINVEGVIYLLNKLKRLRITPIFLSSEMVFDGLKGNYSESDTPNPILLYGKQKLGVENYIKTNFDKYLIFRLAKIYSTNIGDSSILNQFYNNIKNNTITRYASDQLFSPTAQNDFENIMKFALNSDLSGLFHVSSGANISRWEFFQLFANKIGGTVRACKCSLSDLDFLEPRPKNLTLNNKKLVSASNYNFLSPVDGINIWLSRNT